MLNISSLVENFSVIADPWVNLTRELELLDVLVIDLCDVESFYGMKHFDQAKLD